MEAFNRPSNRDEFEIAILCALTVEFDAIDALLEVNWEETQSYSKAPGDPNAYRTGRIGNHNVVVALLPEMGKRSAAIAAAWLTTSFRHVKLGLVVGICGGVPYPEDDQEILLGDIIISTGVIQYDHGRQFPNEVRTIDTLAGDLPRPTTEVRSFLRILSSKKSRRSMQDKIQAFIGEICAQEGFENSSYPGEHNDKLFEGSYRHKHWANGSCAICAACNTPSDPVCELALYSSCAMLGCNDQRTIKRTRLGASSGVRSTIGSSKPLIHFGRIASGDLVMKSGTHRDQTASRAKVIAFEMEGAGVWEAFQTIVIKSVCDYADSHKNKIWQPYAAVAAAACAKAFLLEWRSVDKTLLSPASSVVHDRDYRMSNSTIRSHMESERFVPTQKMPESDALESTTCGVEIPDTKPLKVVAQNEAAASSASQEYTDHMSNDFAKSMLRAAGIDLDIVGANRVLLWAADAGSESGIDYALAHGADLAFKDELTGMTALHLATGKKCLKTINNLLLKGVDISAKEIGGASALHIAAGAGWLEGVETLLANGTNTEASTSIGSRLMSPKGNRRPGPLGFTPPIVSYVKGDTALHLAAGCGHLEVVKHLIGNGAEIDMRNEFGYTPFLAAAKNGQVQTMKFLIDRGTDIKAVSSYDGGVLYLCLATVKRHEDGFVQMLIQNGADINAQGYNGTPLHAAVRTSNVEAIKTLLRNGARMDIKDKVLHQTPEELAIQRRDECSFKEAEHYSKIVIILRETRRSRENERSIQKHLSRISKKYG